MSSRYKTVITENYHLSEQLLINLYMSIRTSTRFRFPAQTLSTSVGDYHVKFTARYFDDYHYDDNQYYRYYLITNDERRKLVRDIEMIQDEDIRKCITDEECQQQYPYRILDRPIFQIADRTPIFP